MPEGSLLLFRSTGILLFTVIGISTRHNPDTATERERSGHPFSCS